VVAVFCLPAAWIGNQLMWIANATPFRNPRLAVADARVAVTERVFPRTFDGALPMFCQTHLGRTK